MVDDPAPRGIQHTLAANVRRARIARHLSLSELARATGTSKATLSGIENGRGNPTVDTLASLAGALQAPLGELLGETPTIGEVLIRRASAARPERHGGVSERVLDAIAPGAALRLTEIALDARQVHEVAPGPPGSRAHLYVLLGRLIAGPVERISELVAGDYAAFPADVPHAYEAGRQPARALLVAQSPGR